MTFTESHSVVFHIFGCGVYLGAYILKCSRAPWLSINALKCANYLGHLSDTKDAAPLGPNYTDQVIKLTI